MLFSSILILQRNKKKIKGLLAYQQTRPRKQKIENAFFPSQNPLLLKPTIQKKLSIFFHSSHSKTNSKYFFLLSPPKPSVCSPPLPTDSAPFSSFLFANAFFSSLFQNFPSPFSTFGSPFINKPKLPFLFFSSTNCQPLFSIPQSLL